MAGSWQHMTTKSGKLRNNETFFELVENGGDWYETAEECYGMVWFLASKVAAFIHDDQVEPTRDQILDVITQAEANYKDGLETGGVQRSH